jgi:cytochrome oxidase Cu insertion factor (SCO1/SenC/PrrC family)
MINNQLKGRLALVGIALMFFVPIFLSWYLVFFSDYKDGIKTVNYGELISPIINLSDLDMKSFSDDKLYSHDKTWILAFLIQEECNELCQENFYQIRQIRLAIGKDQDKLERLVLAKATLDWGNYKNEYPGQKYIDSSMINFDGIISAFKSNPELKGDSIYLIDPYGNLMMQYKNGTDPTGIIKDIERLIRNAR